MKSFGNVFQFYLRLEGLLNICTQRAPFVSLLQCLSCQLHSTLHLIYFHQDLGNNDSDFVRLHYSSYFKRSRFDNDDIWHVSVDLLHRFHLVVCLGNFDIHLLQ